jgi:eukaryotic-like serine/threonine-protein kinase
MIERIDESSERDLAPDDDERVGEAVESFLALAERGQAPDVDEFVARYPDLKDDVRAALEGLELVHGLLGLGSATGSGSGRGGIADHRIESGRRIAGYRVVRELGRGGMGTVYEAVHVGLDRPVALKVLGTHAAPDSSARRRFLNEARTAAGLHHTHIVPVFDVGQVGGLCYYAMQRIEGSGLDRVVRHLRGGRPLGSNGWGKPWSGQDNGAEGSGSSSVNSRLGRLWLRLSSGWRRRPAPMGSVDGRHETRPAPSAARPEARGGAARHTRAVIGLDDSTVSWAGSSRRSHRNPQPHSTEKAVAPAASTGVAAVPAFDADPRGRDDESPPFDPPRGSAYFRWVASLGLQAGDALAHAHRLGVIHRDVKPSNLLVDARGNIWVTDFGLARRLADPGMTHHDSLLGTPRYMSPEQARTGAIDGRTDVYSLGATLYELLTLRPPFDGRSAAELVEQIGQDEPVPPGAIDRRIPRDLETIVLKALAKRPVDRYATGTELAEDLQRFLNREPVKARRISFPGRMWRVACRHPRVSGFSTAAAAAFLAIVAYAYVRIIAERDDARHARDHSEQLFLQAEDAKRNLEREVKLRLLKTVEVVAHSDHPNRRSEGLDIIRELAPEPSLRPRLRDEAVKFLVLREVEAQQPELRTGPARGLVFGPNGHRLALLSEDFDDLAFWDVGRRVRQNLLSLRGISGAGPAAAEAAPAENLGGETGSNGLPAANTNRSAPANRHDPGWFVSQRLAQSGQYVATILPDYKGLALIDLYPGAPVRTVNPPDRAVLGVLGDPGGKRLVTIEQLVDDLETAMAGFPGADRYHYEVCLWNPEHLDQPISRLRWSGGGSPGRIGPTWPLAAISPDGKTVAVAAARRNFVRLFSAADGRPLPSPDGRRDRGYEIDTQTDLSALVLGPNDSLATAGVTSNGTSIKIWEVVRDERTLVGPRTVPVSLLPDQNFTRLMRYSPQGTLLAIAGSGPIELWDPLAHNLVAVLKTNDQTTDLAFAPDGRTLAAAGRSGETAVWTVHNSAARTQLSGFESTPWSLVWSDRGVLTGSGVRGDLWSWRNGRCPELGPPSAPPVASAAAAVSPDPEKLPAASTVGETAAKPDRPTRDSRRNRGREPNPVALAFDTQGRLVAHDSHGLRIWPAATTSAQSPPSFKYTWPEGLVQTWPLTKSADGRTMVFVRSSSLFLWTAEAAEKIVPVTPPPGWEPIGPPATTKANRGAATAADPPRPSFRDVQIAPGGDRVYLLDFTPGQGNLLHAWSIERLSDSRALAHDLKWSVPLADGAISIALRGDGALLAVGDRTGKVTLVDTFSRAIVAKIPPSSGDSEIYRLALAFSPDGQSLAVGSPEGTISLWSLANPRQPGLRYHLPGHRGTTTILAFDPHGRRIASAGTEPLVEVWDLDLIDHELDRLGLAD